MRIAILGLHHDTNQGDPLICRTVEKLYERELDASVVWDELDLKTHRYFKGLPETFTTKVGRKLYRWVDVLYNRTSIDVLKWLNVIFLSWAFSTKIRNAQAGIIAGGGIIHYKFHDYAIGIAAFIRACKIYGIPVIINGVGVEGYDCQNWRCKIFKKYLSYSNVRFISSRDDIKLIKENYIKAKTFMCKTFFRVPDPVVLCSDIFNIKCNKESDIVGIGLIRGSIFSDYRVACSTERLVDFYCGIVHKCKSGGAKYEFFINGFKGDLDIVPLIEKRLGEKLTVSIPNSPVELIKTISTYKSIITARMHSCIVAYSLGVPAIAFVWCEKLRFWGETINKTDCFLPMEQLDADLAWTRMQDALCRPYDEIIRRKLTGYLIESVRAAIDIIKK